MNACLVNVLDGQVGKKGMVQNQYIQHHYHDHLTEEL